MIKRTLITVAGLGLLSVLFFGRDAASYVRTSVGWVKDSVKSNVPIEFEIERARRMVKDLVPDIRKNMHIIAQEEVEIERLDKEIAHTETAMTREKGEILKLKTDLAAVQPVYHYAGRGYSPKQVKVDLANRFERYKTHDATLASLREIQAARRQSLDAARQKLDGMLVARKQLEADVENLEARFKMVEVAQLTSDINIDDSQLGRVKELIADVRTRLKVTERLINSQTELGGEIPLANPQSDDILNQVTEYFSSESEAAKVAETQAAEAH